ncbi:MAG: hypothetical protein RLZZ230_808 [Candidatus Parcubacteria bacterium]|jgi:hypothetical protein
MIWIQNNWFKIGVLVLLAIGIFLWLNLQEVRGISDDVVLKSVSNKDLVGSVKDTYENSTNLPSHNTVCLPKSKYLCSEDGCTESEINVFVLISGDSSNITLSRCDDSPCDTYSVQSDDSGQFKILQPEPKNGMLFKMSYLDLSYTEIITSGTSSYITFGKCKFLN